MPFDILKVPFYAAVINFEKENYKEAFVLFLECALKGNFYAMYYVDYIAKNDLITLSEQQSKAVKELSAYLKSIPQENHPIAWLKSSLCIIKLANSPKPKEQKRLITELENNLKYSPNAGIYLLDFYQKQANPLSKIKKIIAELFYKVDIFTLFHLNQNDKIQKPDSIKKEWTIIEKFAALAYKLPGGDLERLLAKYYDGPDVLPSSPFEQDLKRKYHWQMSGAHLGNKELQYMFSHKSEQSPRTKEELECWLYQAALRGERQAEVTYGLTCTLKKNHQEGRVFLERALKNTNRISDIFLSDAYLQLGKISEEGWGGVETNKKLAAEHYLKAESLGNPIAAENVGIFHQEGWGGFEKNRAKAVQHYEKAIQISQGQLTKEEFARLQLRIAESYYHGGEGLDIDYKKAAEYYKQIMEEDLNAAMSYASLLMGGHGVEKNQTAAMLLLIKNARRGHARSAYNVVRLYMSKKLENREQYRLTDEDLLDFTKLAPRTQEVGINTLYSFLYFEHLKAGPNYKLSYEYLMAGIQAKEINAYTRLGNLYEYGCPQMNIKVDLKKAYENYSLAADLDDPVAINNKGYFLYNGLGVERNDEQAKIYFEKAIEHGCMLGAYGLACMINMQKNPDYKKSFEYLKMAECTQDEDVLYNIGNFYHFGQGVDKDLKKACEYYELAYAKGSHEAGHNYALIQLSLGFNEGSLSETTLKDCLQRFKFAADRGFASGTFMYCMIQLLLDPVLFKTGYADAGLIKKVFDDLSISIEEKPHHRSAEVVDYFKEHSKISTAEILLMITRAQQASTPSIKKIETEQSIAAETKASLETKASIETKASEESLSAKAKKLERLKDELAWFTDPKQIKSINLKAFNRLLGKVSVCEDMIVGMMPSKGSNKRYRVESAQADPLCFSYHPTHASGSGEDSAFDPKRARSMQAFMKNVATTLNLK